MDFGYGSEGAEIHLEDNQLHKQTVQLCVVLPLQLLRANSCKDFPKFSFTTSIGGNGGGQQQQAPPPAVVQPVGPGTVSWTLGVVVKGLEKHPGTVLKAKDIQLDHEAFQWFVFCSKAFEVILMPRLSPSSPLHISLISPPLEAMVVVNNSKLPL